MCFFEAIAGKYFVPGPVVAGAKWQTYIYKELTITKTQCHILCLLER